LPAGGRNWRHSLIPSSCLHARRCAGC
jgi:hypothetical protein